jgi:uncharacterized protein DUF6527
MAVIKHVTNSDGAHYGYRFHCPGCGEEHVIPTKPHPNGWDFDGNEVAPTFSPSINVPPTKRWDGDPAVIIEMVAATRGCAPGVSSSCPTATTRSLARRCRFPSCTSRRTHDRRRAGEDGRRRAARARRLAPCLRQIREPPARKLHPCFSGSFHPASVYEHLRAAVEK